MKNSFLFILAFFFLMALASGCAPAPTPVLPPTLSPSAKPPTFTPEPTVTATHIPSPTAVPSARLEQSNDDGFGDPTNTNVLALESFDNYLYASVLKRETGGSELWRYDGTTWTQMLDKGLNSGTVMIEDFYAFGEYLYAGTTDLASDIPGVGAEVWRSKNGSDWEKVFGDEIDDNDNNPEVGRLFGFKEDIYVSTWSYDDSPSGGLEIWKSPSGERGSWKKVADNGIDGAENVTVLGDAIHNDKLYVGTLGTSGFPSDEKLGWGHIYSTIDGTNWSRAGEIGDGEIYNVSALATFNNYLYAALVSYSNRQKGGEIYRCTACDGSDWEQVFDGIYKHDFTGRKQSLELYDGFLYYLVGNQDYGVELWRTLDGTHWEEVASDGIYDKNNQKPYWDNSMVVFMDKLFIGLDNYGGKGTQVWTVSHK